MTDLIDRELALDSRLSSQERGVYMVVRSLVLPTMNDVAKILRALSANDLQGLLTLDFYGMDPGGAVG